MATDPVIEIASLTQAVTVSVGDYLVIQPGVAGTPLRKATAEQVMNGLIDAIGTSTIVADDVIITGGTATLEVGNIAALTAGTFTVSGTITTGAETVTGLLNAGTITSAGTITGAHLAGTTGAISGLLTAGTVTATIGTVSGLLSAATLSVSGTATADVAIAGDQTLQDASGASPFDYVIRNSAGEVVAAREGDSWYFQDGTFKGDLLVLGEVSAPNAVITPGVPEYAYDVTKNDAIGDGTDQWAYVTWGSSTDTFTAYTFAGDVTIGSGSTELTLDIVRHSGIAFARGIDEGKRIAITGAGVAGADLVTTIVSVVDGATVILADAASTALSASAEQVLWPCFSADQVGSSVWMDTTQVRVYWIGLTQHSDTSEAATKPFLAIVDAYVSPFSLTLDRDLPLTATDAPRRMVIGTDNTQAIADAGIAAAELAKAALWFPGTGLYCSFKAYSGNAEDKSNTFFSIIDSTTGETNILQTADKDMIWLTGKARGFFTDISGRQTYQKIIPISAPAPFLPRRGIHGSKTLAAMVTPTTVRAMKLGDSLGAYDPSRQNQAQTGSTLFDDFFAWPNSDKTITIDNRSLGGATWAELACAANTRGVNVDESYPWFNPATSWLAHATSASPVPHVFVIPQHGINDETGFHPIHFFSVINRLRALTTVDGDPPDIVLNTSIHTLFAPAVPAQIAGAEAQESYGGFIRGFAAKYGYGLIDYEGRALAAQHGWDTTRRVLKRAPNYSHALAPTTPLIIPARCRGWKARLRLIGASGSAVWTAVGTLRIGLSNRPDNYMEITTDGSGFLTTRVQTWGRAVSTTTSITNGDATLTTSGHTTISGQPLSWALKRSSISIGSAGGGTLSGAYDGKCLIVGTTDYNNQPQRTFIEKVLSDSVARVDDFGPIEQATYSATENCYIGGMMFVEHDGHAKSDIIITDGSGNVHQTRIASFTSRTEVELEDPWPYTTLSSAAATIWVGHIAEDTATSTIDATADAGADPFLEVSVLNNQVMVRYAMGSQINDGSQYPVEVPILYNKLTIRGGGPYTPMVRCTGSGLTVDVSHFWTDDDMLFMPLGTKRHLRGSQDATSSYPYGGEAAHAAGPWAEAVWRPVLEIQNFAV